MNEVPKLQTTEFDKIEDSKFAVDKMGVADDVLMMHKDGLSPSQISDALTKKGVKISKQGVSGWIESQKETFNKQLDAETYKKYANIVVSYKSEIMSVLDEVKMLKGKAIEEKQLNTYVKLVGRLYEGIELLAKLMGDIRPQGTVDVNVIIKEINNSSYVDNKGVKRKLFPAEEKIYDAEFEEIKNEE